MEDPYLGPDALTEGPHLASYCRKFTMHFAAKLHDLRLDTSEPQFDAGEAGVERGELDRHISELLHILFENRYTSFQIGIRH